MGRPITARKPHIAYLYDYTTLHEPMELPGLTRGSGAFSESELTHPSTVWLQNVRTMDI